jgi:8-amino-7-oxononanoate synthase
MDAAQDLTTKRKRTWVDRVLRANAEITRLYGANPMMDAVVDEIDGRRLRIGDHWLTDFASCNYLGLDLDEEIIERIPEYLHRWGTHPSWSRMVCNPALMRDIEDELSELLGVEQVFCLPALTLLHNNAIPVLAAGGTLYLDSRAHRTLTDPAYLASTRGTTVHRFQHDDPDDLERLLRVPSDGPRLICMDGVHSMTGNLPDVSVYAKLARTYDAVLYLDDAHGFGLIGEQRGEDQIPYGRRGNGIVRHFGEPYDNIVFTAGFSKAYSSLLAFATCSSEVQRLLKLTSPAYVYSGPPPVATLASALLGMRVNAQRGDAIRARLHQLTTLLLDHVHTLGASTPNLSELPIVTLAVSAPSRLGEVAAFLHERGIYVTLTPYPVVPREDVGFRIQVTAANTTEEILHLNQVITEVDERFGLKKTPLEMTADGPLGR